jgi:broad specificity phosphatase PhoE
VIGETLHHREMLKSGASRHAISALSDDMRQRRNRRKEANMLYIIRNAAAAICCVLALQVAAPVDAARADDATLVSALRSGGLVILLRHGSTFADQKDANPVNFDDPATQRNLDPKGKDLAKEFGDSIRRAGVPVGQVYSSKFNRAYETTVLAGFSGIVKTDDVTESNDTVSAEEKARRAAALKKMLATAPRAGTDTIIVTHRPNIIDALGQDWANVAEGEAGIFRPTNGGFELVARVQMADWARLAQAK